MEQLIKHDNLKFFIIVIIIIAVILLVVFIMRYINILNKLDVSNIEYRTDAQPIIDRFPALPAFQACYWKANTIGRTDFGPTNYWMKGFIVLKKTTYLQLLNDYKWKPVSFKFPKGINPAVTIYQDFCWCSNDEFTASMMAASFIGSFYLDTINGILYFDVENR
jgi:hypothetical protein